LMVFAGSSPITTTSPSSKAHQKSGSCPQPALPGFNGHTTPSDSRHCRRLARRRGRYPRPRRVSSYNYEPPFWRAVPTTRRIAWARVSPHTCGLPQMTGGSASALELSRPARASFYYGPSDRSAAQGRLRRRAPTQSVTRPCRLPASGPIDNYPGETLSH
jgi:hypothetical protein